MYIYSMATIYSLLLLVVVQFLYILIVYIYSMATIYSLLLLVVVQLLYILIVYIYSMATIYSLLLLVVVQLLYILIVYIYSMVTVYTCKYCWQQVRRCDYEEHIEQIYTMRIYSNCNILPTAADQLSIAFL